MRALLVLVAACQASAAPAPTPAQIDGFVIDEDGAAAGVDVALFAFKPAACPCPNVEPTLSDGSGVGRGDLPCQCPEAIAVWRDQLAHCEVGAPLAHARSDRRGHFAFPPLASATAIAATRPTGERWVALAARSGIALELADRAIAHVTIQGSDPATRAGILYPDGHCVPLDRVGSAWQSRRSVSDRADGVVVADGPTGFGAVNWTPELGLTRELELVTTATVRGMCTRPDLEVRLAGPYQRIVGGADARGSFQLDGVFQLEAQVTCRDARGVLVDEFLYTPEHGVVAVSPAERPYDCTPVRVVGAAGTPVADAQIWIEDWRTPPRMPFSPDRLEGSMAHGMTTDARGDACVDSWDLSIDAPGRDGGACAAHRHLTIAGWWFTWWATLAPVPIELDIPALPRASWRGRIVNSEQLPVAGATVRIDQIRRPDRCEARVEQSVDSGADGSVALPALPLGMVTLEITHPWYAQQRFEIDDAGPPRDLVVGRGARWRGRILDPDDKPIESCSIEVIRAGENPRHAQCGPRGELVLDALSAGATTIQVSLTDHPLGRYRSHRFRIVVIANQRRTDDLRWPRGASITGRTVDAGGQPVPGVWLSAVPRGEARPVGQRAEHEVTTVSDANGRFELLHMEPGTWVLEASGTGTRSSRVEVIAGTTGARVVIGR